MRVVLDTGVFFRPAVIAEAAREGRVSVVPTLVLAERRRQLLRDGHDVEAFVDLLGRSGFEIEPLRWDHAMSMIGAGDRLWEEHARDIMIAAHVREGDVLWTTNPRDFLAIGLKPSHVRGV